MNNLSPAAKKMLAVLLDNMTLSEIRTVIGPMNNWLAVLAELEDLQRELEADLLKSASNPIIELKRERES